MIDEKDHEWVQALHAKLNKAKSDRDAFIEYLYFKYGVDMSKGFNIATGEFLDGEQSKDLGQ